MKITDHKIDDINFIGTKKMGGLLVPRGIVMHYTAGYTTSGDIDTLAVSPRPASAHVVVGRDGEITQLVPFNKIAWHAGPSKYGKLEGINKYAIGIEISNCGYLKVTPDGYEDQYKNRIDKHGKFGTGSRRLYSDPADWLQQKHPRLGNGIYAWEPYYAPQLRAVEELVEALMKTYAIEFIVSHEEIDTRGWKTDPGPAFPMQRFQDILKGKYVFPDHAVVPTKPAVFDDHSLTITTHVSPPLPDHIQATVTVGPVNTPTIKQIGGQDYTPPTPAAPKTWWQRWFGR